MAATTSLPGLTIYRAAVRMGSLDMAVGNLPGNNVFKMFIPGLEDVFYKEGSLVENISHAHLLSVFTIIIMTAVGALGLLFKTAKK